MTPVARLKRSGVSGRTQGWLYVVAGAVGPAAPAVLTLKEITTLRDPGYVPTCSLNPVISCGSMMGSSQAEVFGFPNPLLGIAAFAVVVCVGAARLAGFVPPPWFRLGSARRLVPGHRAARAPGVLGLLDQLL
jgi:uncharacterized membrane protein